MKPKMPGVSSLQVAGRGQKIERRNQCGFGFAVVGTKLVHYPSTVYIR